MLVTPPGQQRLDARVVVVLHIRRAVEARIRHECVGAAQLLRQLLQLPDHRLYLSGIGWGIDQARCHDQHRVGVHRGLSVIALIKAPRPERGTMRDSGSVRFT